MSPSGKELGIAAGIAVSSFVAGGIVAKFLSSPCQPEEAAPAQTVASSTEVRPYSKYVSDNSLREPSILKELREHTVANVSRSMMLTDPVECQLLRVILNMLDAKRCIEVGTYTGYNALSCALTIPADGVVYALDVSEAYVKEGYPFFEKANVKDKIIVKIAPALESMDQLITEGQGETFDFIYIDADKLNYENYLDRALLLLRVGGVAVLDNTLQRGRVANLTEEMSIEHRHAAEYMDKLNKKIRLDNRFQLSFLDISDGVTICRKI